MNTLPKIFSIAALASTAFTNAQVTYTWDDGGGNNSWHNSSNWVGGNIPDGTNHIAFFNGLQSGIGNTGTKVYVTNEAGDEGTTRNLYGLSFLTENSNEQWRIYGNQGEAPNKNVKIRVHNRIAHNLLNEGTATIFCTLEIVNDITWSMNGGFLLLSQPLDGTGDIIGQSGAQIDGLGGLSLRDRGNYSGTITTGQGTINIIHLDALRNAGLHLNDPTTNRLTYANGANLGEIYGNGILTLNGTLNAGFKNTDTTLTGVISGGGSFTKEGTGTLTMTADNLHTGTTSIRGGGALQLGDGGTSGSLAGPISIGGGNTLIYNRSDDSTFSNIGGGGRIEVAGSGTLSLNGDHTNLGTVTVSNGQLDVIRDDSGPISVLNRIINESHLRIVKPGNWLNTYDGLISGTGSVDFVGGQKESKFRIEKDQTYTGVTKIEKGTVFLGRNTAAGWIESTSVIGNGYLRFNRPDDRTFSGLISDAISVEKYSSGVTTLTNDNTYTGTTNVVEGTLLVNGSIGTGNVSVGGGAILGGNGTIGGEINSAGRISPGSSTGTLTVNNDVTITGSYLAEIDGTNTDLLDVSGALDIGSATLRINTLSGGFTENIYLIASYGSLAGNFSSVIGLPSGYAIDYAFNGNNIAIIETQKPSVSSITTGHATPTNATSITYIVTFSEAVSGFDELDDLELTGGVTATGATFSNPSADSTTYLVTLNGISGNGTINLSASPSGTTPIKDTANNILTTTGSATNSSITVDHIAPQVTITTTESSPSNATSIAYNCSFSEVVSGFNDFTDFYITGTTTATTDIAATTLVNSGDSQNYTLTLNNLSGEGFLQFRLRRSQITDAAGNLLVISPTSLFDPFSPGLTIDTVAPTATSVTPLTSSPTNASTLDYQITFSEAVQNFDAEADLAIALTGDAAYASATVSDTGDATTFNVSLLGVTGDGGDLQLAAAIGTGVEDLLGNALDSSASGTITIDNIGPTVTRIVPATTGPTGAASLDFDIFFNEPVLNFDTFSDLNLITTGTAGASGATFAGSGDTFTVTLTGVSGVGNLSLELVVPGDVTDTVGNALTATLTSAPVRLSAGQALSWLLEEGSGTTTTESISGETSVATFNGPVTWTAPVSPNSLHAIAVDNDSPTPGFIDAGTLKTDFSYVAGSDPGYQVLSNNWSITGWIRLDATQNQNSDRVIISSDWDGSNGWTFFVKDGAVQEGLGFDFGSGRVESNLSLPLDEEVFVAILGDDSASFGGGNKHRFAVWDGSTWTYSDGSNFSNLRLQGIELGSFNSGQRQFEGAIDEVRIFNKTLTQGDLDSLVADVSPPTVTSIIPATTGPTNASSIDFDVTFRKPVVNFDAFNDLIVGGTATATGATFIGSGNSYTVTLTGITGEGTLTLAANTASDIEDLDGRPLSSSVTSAAVAIDQVSPSATITAITASPAYGTSIEFAVEFSEEVTAFDPSDLLVTFSGTHDAPQVSGSGSSYTVLIENVSGTDDLTLAFDFPNNVTDLTTNPLSDNGTSDTIAVDNIGPVATITRVTSSPTTGTETVFSLSFDSPIQNLSVDDLLVTFSGTHDPPVISGTSSPYTVTISNIIGQGSLKLDLSSSSDITDLNNRPVSAVNTDTIYVDNIAPTVTIARAPTTPSPTNASTIEFLVTFSERVDGVQMSDFIANFPGTHDGPKPWSGPPGFKQPIKELISGISITSFCLRFDNIVGTGDFTVGFSPSTNITDQRGNPFIPGNEQATIIVDQTAPALQSISPITSSPTTESEISFLLTFDEPVLTQPFTGIFSVNHSGTSHSTLQVSSAPGQSNILTVTLSGVTGTGSLTLTIGNLSGITDLAGNPLFSTPVSDPVEKVTAWTYSNWATTYGLDFASSGPNEDPDGDGSPNYQEFALDSDPTTSSHSGKIRTEIAGDGTTDYFTITLPVRQGAVLNPSTSTILTVDDLTYLIQGTTDLLSYSEEIDERPPLDGLPPLSSGWEYRSFRFNAPAEFTPQGFFRIGISQSSGPNP